MDWLRFTCGQCGQHLKARPEDSGSLTVCPVCQAAVRVPASGTAGTGEGALPVAPLETAENGPGPAAETPMLIPSPGPEEATGQEIQGSRQPQPPSADRESERPDTEPIPPEPTAGSGGKTRGAAMFLVTAVLILGGIGLWLWRPGRPDANGEVPSANPVSPSLSPAPATEPPGLPLEPAEPPQPSAGSPPAPHQPVPGPKPLPGGPPPRGGREAESESAAIQRWMAAWEVDFRRLPADATRAVEELVDSLGLSVSPSLYSATSGHQLEWPLRRGTRLEAIEWVGRQLGWIPEYTEGRLRFRRGLRREPSAFAGPFMALVEQVSPSDRWGTATLRIRLTGIGIPPAVQQRWKPADLTLRGWEARSPTGEDLVDPFGEHRLLRVGGNDPRLVELWQEVELWHTFRGVDRIERLTAAIEPPAVAGVRFPGRHFQWHGVPLKPAATTPEHEPPLSFEGDAPVVARLYSVIPDVPYDRARVDLENRADRPLRRVWLRFSYSDTAGRQVGAEEQVIAGMERLPLPRSTRRLDGLLLQGKPDNADRVQVRAVGALFLGGAEWKRAP